LVARFDPQKDLRTFLDASALVRAARPDSRFLLCGPDMDASNRQLGDWIGAVGLADAVHLLGPRRDTPRVFAALDLLVSSSAYGEGFPNVIGEAMACGVPCAVTDVGDSVLIVADTGLGVPPHQPDSLAAAIGRLLDEGPAGLAQRGRAARERIAAHYDLPRIAARYAELYLSVQRGKT
jgi:glycosyltransferase involved in cell wall biosynthesis